MDISKFLVGLFCSFRHRNNTKTNQEEEGKTATRSLDEHCPLDRKSNCNPEDKLSNFAYSLRIGPTAPCLRLASSKEMSQSRICGNTRIRPMLVGVDWPRTRSFTTLFRSSLAPNVCSHLLLPFPPYKRSLKSILNWYWSLIQQFSHIPTCWLFE